MKGTRKPSLFFIGLLKTLLCCTVFLPRYTTLVVTSLPSPKRWRSKGPCMLWSLGVSHLAVVFPPSGCFSFHSFTVTKGHEVKGSWSTAPADVEDRSEVWLEGCLRIVEPSLGRDLLSCFCRSPPPPGLKQLWSQLVHTKGSIHTLASYKGSHCPPYAEGYHDHRWTTITGLLSGGLWWTPGFNTRDAYPKWWQKLLSY